MGKRKGGAAAPAEEDELFPRAKQAAVSEATDAVETAKAKRGRSDTNAKQSLGTKKPKVRPGKEKSRDDSPVRATEAGVELLTFKKLSIGMTLLGAIREVGATDLTIALPNNLIGFATYLTLEGDEDEVESELDGSFTVGQIMRCVVTELESAKGTKRVGLSIQPSLVNNGITVDQIVKGMALVAVVVSVEDTGYILSFGDVEVKGFVSKKAAASRILVVGAIVETVVQRVQGRVATVSLDSDVISTTKTNATSLPITAVKPGALIEGSVRRATDQGAILDIAGAVGTIDRYHIAAQSLKAGTTVSARVIWVDTGARRLGLSLRPELIKYEDLTPSSDITIGSVLNVTVQRVDGTLGLLVKVTDAETPTYGFVHISRVADTRTESLDGFKVGDAHIGRVVSMSLLDGLWNIALAPSIVNAKWLRLEDIEVGSLVQGTIAEVKPFGMLVQLTETIRGLVPLMHLADTTISNPAKKFKLGKSIECRVLVCDPAVRKLILTNKRTLLQSELPLISDYDEVKVGQVSHGYILKAMDSGCLVGFFGGVRGFAPAGQLGRLSGTIQESFSSGMVVKCRVVSVQPDNDRMTVSFVLSDTGSDERLKSGPKSLADVKEGSVLSGVVQARVSDGFVIGLSAAVSAFLPIAHLTDHPALAPLLQERFATDQLLDDLLVLSKSVEKNRVMVTRKPLLVAAAKAGTLPSQLAQLSVKSVYPGYVRNITEFGAFVAFVGDLSGLCTKANVSDVFVKSVADHLQVGQTVYACITEIDASTQRFSLSLKHSVTAASEAHYLPSLFSDKAFGVKKDSMSMLVNKLPELGSLVQATVDDVKDFGVFMTIPPAATGFAIDHQLGGAKLSAGQVVRGRVLDVDKARLIVDLTLRDSLIKAATQQPAKKTPALSLKAEVDCVIELVKNNYLALSLAAYPQHIGFAAVGSFNLRRDAFATYTIGSAVKATVTQLPSADNDSRLLLSVKEDKAADSDKPKKRTARFFDQSVTSMDDVVNGKKVTVKVLATGRKHIVCAFSTDASHAKGEIIRADHDASLTESIKQYDELQAVVLTRPCHAMAARLAIGPAAAATATKFAARDKLFTAYAKLQLGETVQAVVTAVTSEGLDVKIGKGLAAKIDAVDASADVEKSVALSSAFKVGTKLSCTVLKIDADHETLLLSGRPVVPVTEGDIVAARPIGEQPSHCITLQLPGNQQGTAHVCDLFDAFVANPLEKARRRKVVRAYVLRSAKVEADVDEKVAKNSAALSLRESRVSGAENASAFAEIQKFDDVHVGQIVQGYVKATTDKGCFVYLARDVQARVLIKDLSDDFVKDVAAAFPPLTPVVGRVLSIEPEQQRVSLSLKQSVVLDKQRLTIEDIRVGMRVPGGQVKNIAKYGLFLNIANSGLTAFVHTSEISDDTIDLETAFSRGDRVRAVIVKVDVAANKIWASMRAEKLATAEDNENSSSDEEDEDEEVSSNADDDDAMEADSDSEQAEDSFMADASDSDSSEEEETQPASATAAPAAWQGFSFFKKGEDQAQAAKTEEKDSSDEDNAEHKQRAKRQLARERKQQEEDILDAEQRQVEHAAPQTTVEFEKLVLASPNSSFVWIRYMAFHLGRADVAAARTIAERALKTINYREEEEKLNVWVAFMNLENRFGDAESLDKVFGRACQFNDPKKIHLQLVKIFEAGDNAQKTAQLFETITQKFKDSAKVWLLYGAFLQKTDNADAMRKLLPKALAALPKRKHLKVIAKFGQFEFKFGDADRGRTIFESIISNYPKRIDMWNVYLDMEIRAAQPDMVRRLFERCIAQKLSVKKMKHFFKRYLEYEQQNGTEETVDHVRRKAVAFVEAKSEAN
eukprot:TRINITY_DN8771_c0_g1_i1.p1 TRINITY_DN8771_c0_g1~~TRINITY_DN8771_c0_g1_i1.p1  ORF type:complete len:1836 (-),score=578.71 TRINITY_DN8771_c0_g1_i1:2327-7834(-)